MAKAKKLNLENPKPGLYFDVSFEDYVKIDAVNNSVLKIFADQSPAHARYYMDHGRPETKVLAFGSVADCYILETQLFYKKYIVGPEARGNSKEWKGFVAEHPDKTVIKPSDFHDILGIYQKISESSGMRLISGGFSQVVLIWIDKPTGLLCKGRLDYLNQDLAIITDLKTTKSAKPSEFSRDIGRYKYHQQGAFYTDGYKEVTGEENSCFCFFAVEKVDPYISSQFQLGDRSIEAGRMQYRTALDAYAKCVKTNSWPPYCDGVVEIDIPYWELEKAGMGTHNITNMNF